MRELQQVQGPVFKEIALGLMILGMFWDLAGFGVNSWDWGILGVIKTQFVGGLRVGILRLKLRFGDQKWGGVFGVRTVYKLFANWGGGHFAPHFLQGL
jgi:hypothetical protein